MPAQLDNPPTEAIESKVTDVAGPTNSPRTSGMDAADHHGEGAITQRARALGLPSATVLVIGSIIGTGVFTMPVVMAGAGTSSLLVLGVISIGALLLGAMFGS